MASKINLASLRHKYSRPAPIKLPVVSAASTASTEGRSISTASTASTEGRSISTASTEGRSSSSSSSSGRKRGIADLLPESDCVSDYDDDEECTIPIKDIPAVLLPAERRQNDIMKKSDTSNPLICDPAVGAAVDAYLAANCTPAQLADPLSALSRMGANFYAKLCWLTFENDQGSKLSCLIFKFRQKKLTAKSRPIYDQLMQWFTDRRFARKPLTVRDHFKELDNAKRKARGEKTLEELISAAEVHIADADAAPESRPLLGCM